MGRDRADHHLGQWAWLKEKGAPCERDGNTLVDGAANFPFPAPFIRVDTEN